MGLNVGVSILIIFLIEKSDAKNTYNFFSMYIEVRAVGKGWMMMCKKFEVNRPSSFFTVLPDRDCLEANVGLCINSRSLVQMSKHDELQKRRFWHRMRKNAISFLSTWFTELKGTSACEYHLNLNLSFQVLDKITISSLKWLQAHLV